MNLSWRVTALFLKFLGPWHDMPCVKHAPHAVTIRSSEDAIYQDRYRSFLQAVLSNKLVIKELEERYQERVYSLELCCMIAVALLAATVYGEEVEWCKKIASAKPYLFQKVTDALLLPDTAQAIFKNVYKHGFCSHAPYALYLKPGLPVVSPEKAPQLKTEWYAVLKTVVS